MTGTGLVLVWTAMQTDPAVMLPPSPVVYEQTVIAYRTVIVTPTETPEPTLHPFYATETTEALTPHPTFPLLTHTPTVTPTATAFGLVDDTELRDQTR